MSVALLGLYWRERRAGLEECAEAVHKSLLCMAGHGYETFFQAGKSRRTALERPFDVSPSSVENLLASGVNRTDVAKAPIPELGWSMSLWSGDADSEAYKVMFHCGACSKRVGNNVVINLPKVGRHGLAEGGNRAIKLYGDLLKIWNPAQAVLCDGSISWERGSLIPGSEPLAQRKLSVIKRLLG